MENKKNGSLGVPLCVVCNRHTAHQRVGCGGLIKSGYKEERAQPQSCGGGSNLEITSKTMAMIGLDIVIVN